MKTKFITVNEGNAKLLVPEKAFSDPFHLPVFYNPAMGFNRKVSSLALKFCLPMLDDSTVVDGLCALGSRGILYAKENKLKRVYFVDANPDAIKVLKKNIKLNGLKNAKVAEEDLNKFFVNSSENFDFIEIDPFGSPVFFLQNAIRKLKKIGILSITATDLANLAGGKTIPTKKHYNAKPIRNEYSHEIALRILIGKIAKELALQDYGCQPLVSFYRGHAIKAMVLCERNSDLADKSLEEIGYIMHCEKCLNRKVSKRIIGKCDNCKNKFEYAGELWIGKMQKKGLLLEMEKDLEIKLRDKVQKKGDLLPSDLEILKFIKFLIAENDFGPTFYDLHVLAKKFSLVVRKTDDIMLSLKMQGFDSCKVHYVSTGIKTDAGIREMKRAMTNKK
ncbi:methyltransferase domain-containing protein [Candidatus Micrarchaeota archaeon]|nr:methyltransferase domain-containing protein [Candidatus Micrarchaeota archaeon]